METIGGDATDVDFARDMAVDADTVYFCLNAPNYHRWAEEVAFPAEPVFSAFYELESPDVLASEAWSKAVEQGRWAAEIRPFTSNRRHTLHKLIVPKT